ncbi:hypothetical protein BJX61DRAFT_501118 [Aspergillus egyptiacus]|nr:hypothetical protein BJX61DRAFT_501118 [Aspergillus egyptiacus]
MKLANSSFDHFVEACGQLMDKVETSSTSREHWMETILVSVIWASTNPSPGEDHSPQPAEAAALKLTRCGLATLSDDATHASLLIIWKYIDTMLAKESISVAQEWCYFVLKQTLLEKDPDTRDKFFRKLILCALEKQPPFKVHEIFDGIPDDYKTCPLTRYLIHRLSLAADDVPLAVESFQLLCKSASDSTLVWSCISDALKAGKVEIVAQSLKGLVSVSDGNNFRTLEIPQLLQYVLCALFENQNGASRHLLEHLVPLFESASEAARRGPDKLFTPGELRWLSYKSYSIALELHKLCPVQTIVQLLKNAVNLAELSQDDQTAESKRDLLEHVLRCYFLQSTITIAEARRETSPTTKASHYKTACEIINQFQTCIWSQEGGPTAASAPPGWLEMYRSILSFSFEATVHLRQCEDLIKTIETSKAVVDAKLASVFLDCLLRSGAPPCYLSKLVKQMIRTFHSPSSPPPFLNTASSKFTATLPRYLRCLYSLSTQAEEYILAESVLDQALMLARDNSGIRAQYPKDEIQWLATMAFNRAVEFFLVSADEECRRWAGKAIALADLIEVDREELGRVLRENFKKLQSG